MKELLSKIPVQMNTREKYAVGIAAAAILFFVVFQFIVTPVLESRERKHRLVKDNASKLEEMRVLKAEYQQLVNKVATVRQGAGSKDKGFTLFSFLEKIAGTTGIKDNISYMKPSETTEKDTKVTLSLVEMKLQSVNTEKLMTFLHSVETSPNMILVRGVSITKAGKEKKKLNAILQFETVKQ